jgi:hypothetical protein
MAMTYDPRHRVATWTFPGFPAQSLPAGEYQLTLRSSSISDATGLHLDGNKDGLGGDDFVLSKLLRIKPARV